MRTCLDDQSVMNCIMDANALALWSAYNAALRAVSSAGAGKGSGGIERRYGLAYRNLVRAGLAPQLRKRYRG